MGTMSTIYPLFAFIGSKELKFKLLLSSPPSTLNLVRTIHKMITKQPKYTFIVQQKSSNYQKITSFLKGGASEFGCVQKAMIPCCTNYISPNFWVRREKCKEVKS